MRCGSIHSRRRPSAGFTVLELMVTVVSMVMVLGGSAILLLSTRGAWQVGGTQSSLQEVGRRILDDVLADIRRSGLTSVAGQSLPAIFERPVADMQLSQRGPLIATMNYSDVDLVSEVLAYNGLGNRINQNQNRVSNEFMFQRPTDQDGDDRPIDASGNLEWSGDTLSYFVVREPNGINWLYQVTEQGGVPVRQERVGPWVRSITFDVVFNDRSLRFGEVAVVVYLERLNDQGQLITAALEGSVVLRNTQEL